MAEKEPSLGKMMKEMRLSAKMTHEDVKEKTGYCVSTISEIENDKGFPKYYTVSDLAECYGRPIAFLTRKPDLVFTDVKPALAGYCLPCEGFVVKRLRY